MTLTILILNDIHLDPYFNTSSRACKSNTTRFSMYGAVDCDSTPFLYEKLLKHIIQPCIFLGDIPAHGQNKNFDIIQKVFKDLNCQGISLGNNDAEHNYNFDSKRLQQFKLLDSNFQQSGMYINRNFHQSIVYIGLNTIMLQKEDQFNQLSFLESELKLATLNKNSVIIGCHIPFGSGYFKGDYIDPLIRQNYIELLKVYQKIIIMEVNGHYHTDWWRWIDSIPSFINPGVSPSNGNYPGFRKYLLSQFDGTWRLVDYIQYYFDLDAKQPDFIEQYRFSNISKMFQYSNIDGQLLKKTSIFQYQNEEFMHWRSFQRNMKKSNNIDQIIENMMKP